ncbi:MAG TPA: signal peptidase II [Candidatus Nanoarchaeia archaeon]|nr:signal peptidase II [Candidatus Nanoarchaeia archaeon]
MVKIKDIVLIFILVFLDQLTKILSKNKNFFIINYTENTGAAFSLFQGYKLFLILISVIVIFFTLYYFIKIKQQSKKLYISLILILSGTIGNLIDRISFGFVRDFIDLKIWPIFNLADSYNVVAFILILIYYFKKR